MLLIRFSTTLVLVLGALLLSAQAEPSSYTTIVPASVESYHKALESSLLNGKVDTAWVIYDKMIANVDSTDDVHVQAWIWYHYGDVLSYSEQYVKSNEAYHKAIELSNSMITPNVIILIRGHNNIYYNNDELGNVDVAFDNILKAYEYLAYAPPGESKSNIIFNVARGLKRQGEVGMASRYMEQVLELDQQGNDSLAIGYDYQFLGEIYRLQKDIPKTLSAYRAAINITPVHHADRIAMYHNGIADAYGHDDKLDSALIHSEIAVAMARKANLKNILAFALREKGEICAAKGDRICAEVALNEANLLSKSLGMKDLNAKVKILQAKNLSGSEKKRLLNEVLNEAQKNDWEEIELTSYNALVSDRRLLSGQERTNILQQYNTRLKDRLANNAGQEAKRLEARMALIKSDQEINRLKQEAEISQKEASVNRIIRYVLLALVLLSIAGTILVYQTLKQKRKLAEANYRNQISAQVNEMAALQSRLTSVLDQKQEILSIPDLQDLNKIIDTPLTDKEYEILVDVSKGMTNKAIGEKQFISANTVKFHLKNVFAKLDVANRKEAINRVMSDH